MADQRPTTEPAIPLLAPLPLQAHEDLLELAKRDWTLLQDPGVKFSIDVTEQRNARLAAVVRVHDFDAGGYATRTYNGEWSAGGIVQWSPGRSKRDR